MTVLTALGLIFFSCLLGNKVQRPIPPMSYTLYGLDVVVGSNSYLSTISYSTALWTHSPASPITYSDSLDTTTFWPSGLVWNGSTMYLTATDGTTGKLYTLDLSTALATYVVDITIPGGFYQTLGGGIAGLAWDGTTCYATIPKEYDNDGLATTYSLNLTTGVMTALWGGGSPPANPGDVRPLGLFWDLVNSELRGIGSVPGIAGIVQLCNVTLTGDWSISNNGNTVPTYDLPSGWGGNQVAQAITWTVNPGAAFLPGTGNLPVSFTFNSTLVTVEGWVPSESGAWTTTTSPSLSGAPGGLAEAQAPICVAKGTEVRTLQGLKRIEQLRQGDILMGEDEKQIPLVGLVKLPLGSMRLHKIEAGHFAPGSPETDLLIARGHPMKVGKRIVYPESVGAAVDVEGEKVIFTLLTERRTFVNMQGVLVGTWSQDAWKNFVNNDPNVRGMQWELIE